MSVTDYVADLWYMIAGRIAPPFCSAHPSFLHQLFQKALNEVSKQDGDMDIAVQLLQKILLTSPPEWMVFDQSGQLLNVIGWRITYHKDWFASDHKVHRFKPGKCGRYVAHAYALMQAAADDEALDLVAQIIERGDPGSDDVRIARLIRAAVRICQGQIQEGEDELRVLDVLDT